MDRADPVRIGPFPIQRSLLCQRMRPDRERRQARKIRTYYSALRRFARTLKTRRPRSRQTRVCYGSKAVTRSKTLAHQTKTATHGRRLAVSGLWVSSSGRGSDPLGREIGTHWHLIIKRQCKCGNIDRDQQSGNPIGCHSPAICAAITPRMASHSRTSGTFLIAFQRGSANIALEPMAKYSAESAVSSRF